MAGGTVRRIRRRLAWVASVMLTAGVALVGAGAIGSPAQAANGTILRTITAQSPACGSGVGTGLGFDGTQLLVDCWNSNQIWGVSPSDGSVLHTYTIAGPSSLGAMAWDRGRGKLWICNDEDDVYLADLTTQTATLAFVSAGCIDGLAYDGTDDTIWSSADVASTVQHYKADGTLLTSSSVSGLLGGCGNSGIAVGGSSLLLANNGCSQIYLAPKSLDSSTLFGDYPARLEDLECDDLTFAGSGKAAIWSKDAYDNVLNAFELNPGTCGFGGLPPGPSKSLVAFGDSIAAGEGSGKSDGYPDNPGAYPAKLAAELGWQSYNFAISGACAANAQSGRRGTPSSCSKSILDDQIPLARSMNLHPDLVTITVGANDIQFAECFAAVVGLQRNNPCSGAALDRHLNALASNLRRAVIGIHEMYPNVPIAVTTYFNPLPGVGERCALMPPLYLYKTVASDNNWPEAARVVLTGQLPAAAQRFQNVLAREARRIIGELNDVLQRTARQQTMTTVPLNFTGHDLCKDYTGSGATAWVFGPALDIFASVHNRFTGFSQEWDYIPVHRCTPTPKCDTTSITRLIQFQRAGTTFTFSVLFRSNDLPHLTSDGHEAVARLIRTRLALPASAN